MRPIGIGTGSVRTRGHGVTPRRALDRDQLVSLLSQTMPTNQQALDSCREAGRRKSVAGLGDNEKAANNASSTRTTILIESAHASCAAIEQAQIKLAPGWSFAAPNTDAPA